LEIDVTGKVVKQMNNIIDSQVKLSRDNVSQGLYLIEIKGDKIIRGKVVVK